ncbi:hypothetical protein J2Z28_004015 [Paenibacillus xylanexedens]|uniref:Uncharacterized protein n=1 Tax=Paenibacillus xylanexedens TaxID=528191 RepID=A0ABS4RWT5_PAEXY|nr:hypothetical protein [Paenibacillus xylanexedens]
MQPLHVYAREIAKLKPVNNEDEPKQGVVRHIPVTPLRGEQQ